MYIMSEQPMEEDEGTTELGLRSYPYYETFLVPLLLLYKLSYTLYTKFEHHNLTIILVFNGYMWSAYSKEISSTLSWPFL